jgi:hypothetical protein
MLKNIREFFANLDFLYLSLRKKQRSLMGRGARSSPFFVLVSLKDGCAQRTDTMRGQNPLVEKSNQHFPICKYDIQ